MSALRIILPTLLFVYSFLSVLHPIDYSYDTDLFWHLKTGEVIVQGRGIPAEDPFTYPSKDPLRQALVLQSYWLADVLLYAVHAAAGYAGLVVLKSVAVSITVLLVYLSVLHRGVLAASGLSFVLAFYLSTWAVLKPNLFSFPLMAAVVFCLERYRQVQAWPYQAGLAAAMIVWANMHGGYVFGVVVLGTYAGIEGARSILAWRKGSREESGRLLRAAVTAAAAAAASLLNPGGITTFRVVRELSRDPSQEAMTSIILEHIGYFKHLDHFANIGTFWGLALAGLVVVFTVLNLMRRKAGLVETAVVGVMLGLAVSSIRVFPIFVIVGFIVSLGKERYDIWPLREGGRGQIAVSLVLVAVMGFFLWRQFPVAHPGRLQETGVLPLRAADFLSEQGLRGNMLNLEFSGNFLLFRLYPRYRVFTDSRYVNVQAFFDANAMFEGRVKSGPMRELYEYPAAARVYIEYLHDDGRKDRRGEYWYELIEKHRIDFIVGKVVNHTGGIFPIFLKLMHDPLWKLVYHDNNYVVLVKSNGVNDEVLKRVPPQDKAFLYDQALSELAFINTGYSLESLAFVFAMKGEYDRAEQLARGAMSISPNFLIAPAVAEYAARKKANGAASMPVRELAGETG